MEPSALTDIQVDAIREISSIGMGHAATALSQLLDTTVTLAIPSVECLELPSVHDFVGGAEVPVAGVLLRVSGDLQGLLMMLFPLDSALCLASHLTDRPPAHPHPLDELSVSALTEIGNILGSAYLNAVAAMLKLTLFPSVPVLRLDMAGAVLDPILSRQCRDGDTSLLITAEFAAADREIAGRFYLMPDPESLELIVTASGTGNA